MDFCWPRGWVLLLENSTAVPASRERLSPQLSLSWVCNADAGILLDPLMKMPDGQAEEDLEFGWGKNE